MHYCALTSILVLVSLVTVYFFTGQGETAETQIVSVPVPMTAPPTMFATSHEVKEQVEVKVRAGFRTYKITKNCIRSTLITGGCEIPACGVWDVDMGISRTGPTPLRQQSPPGQQSQRETLERSCTEVLALPDPTHDQHGFEVGCAGDLSDMPGNQLPAEVEDTYEWTSTSSRTIHLELWGGGGGGSGPTRLQSPPPTSAWICGAGGGAGAAVGFAWRLKTGWSYRLEIGAGGRGWLLVHAFLLVVADPVFDCLTAL